MPLIANISNIARASLHDGPGLRTVVYFKGCLLHCDWCHNPETLTVEKEILYAPSKCIHCGKCIEICPSCHVTDGNDMVFLRETCRKCGCCADACPSGALSVSGKQMSVEEIMSEIRKDSLYYKQSGGGVTLSGGECLLQADVCAEMLKQCKTEGLHTAIETALFVPFASVEKVLPFCDLFFADFKIADTKKHELYIGQNNLLITKNLKKLVNAVPKKVILRIPLIPGVNDLSCDIADFAEVLLPFAEKLSGIEILRYNDLAKSKYMQTGKEYTDFGSAQTDEFLLDCCNSFEQAIQQKTSVYTIL